jgi:prepilin-type N-terminal cleavage/methylation domain-containing protein
MFSNTDPTKQNGFTLIELSIVLVIIGLIVGGVLSGQDLIKAAQIRAVLKQKESFDRAANTFRVKYGDIPGSYNNNGQTAFGSSFSLNGVAVFAGRGDGMLKDLGTGSGYGEFANAPFFFWSQLAAAGYIDGSYRGSGTAVPCLSALPCTPADIYNSTMFPPSKLARNAVWHAFTTPSGNFYALATMGSNNVNWLIDTTEAALTPREASDIDTKIDDGFGDNGRVRALSTATSTFGNLSSLEPDSTSPYYSGVAPSNGAAGTANACLISPLNGSAAYNVTITTPSCSLRLKASF